MFIRFFYDSLAFFYYVIYCIFYYLDPTDPLVFIGRDNILSWPQISSHEMLLDRQWEDFPRVYDKATLFNTTSFSVSFILPNATIHVSSKKSCLFVDLGVYSKNLSLYINPNCSCTSCKSSVGLLFLDQKLIKFY